MTQTNSAIIVAVKPQWNMPSCAWGMRWGNVRYLAMSGAPWACAAWRSSVAPSGQPCPFSHAGLSAWLSLAEPLGRHWWLPAIRQTGSMTVAEVMRAFACAWNTDDDAGRLRLLAAACVPDAVFVARNR
jgi:hypothetical protein